MCVERGCCGFSYAEPSHCFGVGSMVWLSCCTVLGGEASCATSVRKAVSGEVDGRDMSAPDEADVGAGGVMVAVSVGASVDSVRSY